MTVVARHQDLIDELLAELESYKPGFDRDLIGRAFEFAAQAHDGQLRRSGQEFIHHPWGAAKILAGLQMDEPTIAAALLHDTIEDMGKQTQVRKARETLEVYAPLAHRLGIHALKWELEDLAFGTLHPRKYEEIKQMGAERRTDREEHVREAAMVLQQELDKVDIPADISGRAKHFYSIYDKMAKKGREFNEIYDLTAMRVIVERSGDEGTRDCYGVLGLIHSLWKPMPGRFKDFIAMPKFNGYRALHTTVIGPQGRPLEIQV